MRLSVYSKFADDNKLCSEADRLDGRDGMQKDVDKLRDRFVGLGLVEPPAVGSGPPIQPLQVSLQSTPTLQQIDALPAPSLLSSANLLMVDSIPSSRSSMMM